MVTKFFGMAAIISFTVGFWGFAEIVQGNKEFLSWAAGGLNLGLVSLLLFGLSRMLGTTK